MDEEIYSHTDIMVELKAISDKITNIENCVAKILNDNLPNINLRCLDNYQNIKYIQESIKELHKTVVVHIGRR